MRSLSRLLTLLLAMGGTFGVGTAQQQSQVQLYIPLIQTPMINGTDMWEGVLTQTGGGNIYRMELNLSQTGTAISGTATIRDGLYNATMRITGNQFGSTYLLDETAIITQTALPPGVLRWCLKTMVLAITTPGETPILSGTWKQDGCNSGRVYFQRPGAAVVDVSGRWSGTLLQGTTAYSVTLDLTQGGNTP